MQPSEDALFDFELDTVLPVADRTQQWRLEALLLCNWGGFGAITVIDMHHDSTLLSGASGAGKSTILDAYAALLNPGRPFNIASNELGAQRRNRNEGVRTTLTYVRGQFDRVERDGVLVPRVLRGDGQDTWSAIAAVFVSSNGTRLSPLRLFFAPQEASAPADMTAVYGIFSGHLEHHHIEALEPLAAANFRKDVTEKALPGLRITNQGQYVDTLQAKLHIGTAGQGAKALKLLHELQSGKPQPSVDALFKQMVLEEPVTFAEADAVIASFDKLDEGYREICEKEAQLDVLSAIEEDHDAFVRAQSDIARLDTLSVTSLDRSPFLLWASRHRSAMYAAEIALARELQQDQISRQGQWLARQAELQLGVDDLAEQFRRGEGRR